ncbi:MAG TPA: hypothetical protein VGO14_03095 [Solirubrobacteraceae bacterium]|jgi:hypothetical protein|nr:hypothetical protein [Solirubrobacteraceae bacterium]
MSSSQWRRGRARRVRLKPRYFCAVLALVAVSLAATAGAALASNANIVRQGTPPAKFPPNTHYFKTIQAAVNASTAGDYVLIEPGVYYEAVKVTSAQAGIWIRGMNRNTVILDGQNKTGNGIEIYKTNNVWVDNLTVRNFDTGSECSAEDCGNGIWWNGGANTNKIGAHGWYGSYLTAYDTGLNGGYGIFTGHETEGSWDNIYASGFNDSGMYLGACQECKARITRATMENNSLGYSGSNSGGSLAIEWSVFRHNSSGVLPNSENPGDAPPPQDGECNRPNIENPEPTPTITTTKIPRCTVIRYNLISENNNSTVPVNGSTERASFGNGIILPGTYADLIEKNFISDNEKTGVFGIEYPNPLTPENGFLGSIFFQLAGNKISKNVFAHNGYFGGPFTGDVTLASGANEIFLGTESQSKNNCVSGNVFTAATFPAKIQGTWGCQNETTPNPGGAPQVYEYIGATAEEAALLRKPTGQPVPPPQQTMPNPCKGAPKNPLCP